MGLVFLIKWLIQATREGKEIKPGGSKALEILTERYARGEIQKEEHETKKKDIMASSVLASSSTPLNVSSAMTMRQKK